MSKAPKDEQLTIDIHEGTKTLQTEYIRRESIVPDPEQPRKEPDAELRAAIAAGGIIQPITVRLHPTEIGMYMIIDGERRWRGAEGVQDLIPCLVRRDLDDVFDRMRTQLNANTGKALTPVEEAYAYHEMMKARPDWSTKQLADFLRKPLTTVSQRLNLMDLGPWLQFIQSGLVSYTQAVEYLLEYRKCPDAVHAAVIEELEIPYFAKEKAKDPLFDEEGPVLNDWEVAAAYKKHLYPITSLKGSYDKRPILDAKAHDAECTCGSITLEKVRYCGDPGWWESRAKELQKAERAKQTKKKSSAPAPRKEQSWEKADRLRRENGARVMKAAPQILEALAGVIKKGSVAPKSVLRTQFEDEVLRKPYTASEKAAAKLVPAGSSLEDLVRYTVMQNAVSGLDHEYNAHDKMERLQKEFGVNLKAIVDKVAPVAAKESKAAADAKTKGKAGKKTSK
jgi:ParB/RepB/Spo0J family partition protein